MTTLEQAARQALEALKNRFNPKEYGEMDKAITALRQALEQQPKQQPKQEPVAWMSQGGDVSRSKRYFEEMGFTDLIPLYTEPPKREWVGLTDEDMIADLWLQSIAGLNTATKFARAIEAKLKELNT
jgi:hypothetical protein